MASLNVMKLTFSTVHYQQDHALGVVCVCCVFVCIRERERVGGDNEERVGGESMWKTNYTTAKKTAVAGRGGSHL